MIFKDYYKILGLSSNKVSNEEIKAAFREQAKKYHPDVNSGSKTEERFKDINEAYKILSNVTSKRKYDRIWNTHISKRQAKQNHDKDKARKESLFSDLTSMFFGATNKKESENEEEIVTNKKVPVKGDNIETEINISIEDAFYGGEKKISLRTMNRKNENLYSKNSIRDKR